VCRSKAITSPGAFAATSLRGSWCCEHGTKRKAPLLASMVVEVHGELHPGSLTDTGFLIPSGHTHNRLITASGCAGPGSAQPILCDATGGSALMRVNGSCRSGSDLVAAGG